MAMFYIQHGRYLYNLINQGLLLVLVLIGKWLPELLQELVSVNLM